MSRVKAAANDSSGSADNPGLRWRVARRYLRSRSLRWSVLPLAVVILALSASYVVISGLTLTNAQIVERDLGRFDLSIQPGIAAALKGDAGVLEGPLAAVRAAGANQTLVLIESVDVRPDVTAPPLVRYRETTWDQDPFPGRYTLVSGQWPHRPGEVLVTERLTRFLDADRLAVLSGSTSLSVTGVVRDRFATRSLQILAAPGTWTALPWAVLAQRYPNLSGSVTVLGVGGDADSAQRAVAALPQAVSAGTTLEQVQSGTNQRETMLTSGRAGGLTRSPLAYQATSAVLVPLGVVLAFALSWRRSTRQLGVLQAAGVRRGDGLAAIVLSTSMMVGVAVLAPLMLGWGAAAITRPLVADWAGQPLSPLAGPGPLLLRLGALSLAALVVMAVCMALAHHGSTVRVLAAAVPRPRVQHNLRQVLLAAALIAATWQAAALDTARLDTWLMPTATVAVLLIGPSAAATVLARLPADGARRRLIREGLRLDRVRVVIAMAVIAATTGPVLAILTINQSSLTMQRAQAISLTPARQAYVTPVDFRQALPPAVLTIAADAAGPGQGPVAVHPVASASGTSVIPQAGNGMVIAVDSPGDVARLFAAPLQTDDEQILLAGGALTRAGDVPAAARPLSVANTDGSIAPGPLMPARQTRFDPSWGQRWAAVILTSTATRLRFPLGPASYVFTDLTAPQKIKQALITAGYDPSYVDIYQLPDIAGLSQARRTTAMVLIGLLVLALAALGRSQHVAVLGHARLLLAIGLRRSWISQVLAARLGLAVVGGFLLGVPIAMVSVAAQAWRLPNYAVDVPWIQIGGLFLFSAVATVLSTIVGAVTLRLSDLDRSSVGDLARA